MKQTEKYLEFVEYARKLSHNTVKSIAYDIEMYETIMNMALEDSMRSDVESFVIQQNKESLSSATIARRLSSLKGFFEWQIFNGLRQGINPAEGKIAPKIKNVSHQAISFQELQQLYDHAPLDSIKVAIALMGYAGLRLGEVVALGDYNKLYQDTNGNYAVELNHTKGDKERDVTLALVPDIEPIKQAYAMGGIMGTRGLLSSNGLWRQMSAYFKQQGHEDLSPHGLRATFATLNTKQGLRVDVVRDMLGHTTLNGNTITSKYVGTVGVEEQYQELMSVWYGKGEDLC